jgi:hypothetical protein
MFRSFEFALDKCFVDDHLRSHIRQFAPLPRLHLFLHWLEVALHPIEPTETQSMSENDFECLASTGVNTPETMFQIVNATRFKGPTFSKWMLGILGDRKLRCV